MTAMLPVMKANHVVVTAVACSLNNIPDFHVTKNFVLDLMHIALEGIVPHKLGFVTPQPVR